MSWLAQRAASKALSDSHDGLPLTNMSVAKPADDNETSSIEPPFQFVPPASPAGAGGKSR